MNAASRHPPTSAQVARTRVLCADDNPGMIVAFGLLLDNEPSMVCVGTLNSADRLVEVARSMSPRPDIVIIDARMPGRNPFEAVTDLSASVPAIRTLIYTGYDDEALMAQARAAGAWGCVSKQEEPEALLEAVREIVAGRMVWRDHPRAH